MAYERDLFATERPKCLQGPVNEHKCLQCLVARYWELTYLQLSVDVQIQKLSQRLKLLTIGLENWACHLGCLKNQQEIEAFAIGLEGVIAADEKLGKIAWKLWYWTL